MEVESQDAMKQVEGSEIGFGSAELAFILASFGPAAAESARVMGMDLDAASDEVRAAGASSLFAKGWLDIIAGDASPSGPAEVLGYVLAAATRWTELGFMASREEMLDGALVVSAPEATMLMQPRALGSWTTVLKDPAHGDAEAVRALIDAFAATTPGGVIFLATRSTGEPSTLFIRPQQDGRWEMIEGEATADSSETQVFDQVEADQILARLLGSEDPR